MKTRFLIAAGFAAALWAPSASRASEDPKALAALKRMSDSLSSAQSFAYTACSTVEVPAKTGQFITLFSTVKVALRRPDKLSIRFAGEAPRFDFFYDGTTAAAYAPGTKVYSQVKAPSTIDAMLPALEQETGIRMMTAPLLLSNPYQTLTQKLTSAAVIGPAVVRGVPCEHLAFRSPGVNWEIWIASGSRALPLRVAATFTDRPNFPRALVEFSQWNLHPWLRSGDFVFRPPAGVKEIPFPGIIPAKLR